jgi:hypothetical protein
MYGLIDYSQVFTQFSNSHKHTPFIHLDHLRRLRRPHNAPKRRYPNLTCLPHTSLTTIRRTVRPFPHRLVRFCRIGSRCTTPHHTPPFAQFANFLFPSPGAPKRGFCERLCRRGCSRTFQTYIPMRLFRQ